MVNKKNDDKKLNKRIMARFDAKTFNKITGYCEIKNITKNRFINDLINEFFERVKK